MQTKIFFYTKLYSNIDTLWFIAYEVAAIIQSIEIATLYFTGVDYFDPVLVKQKRSTLKLYGCIFTCLSSRAVYIEVVPDMSSSFFINAVRHFIDRRGKPCKMYRDNGSNFVGSERELHESLQLRHRAESHAAEKYSMEIQSILRQPYGRSMGASH